MNPGSNEKQPFITYLEDLVRRQDRAALAHLRRGLGKPPGTALDMCRYVAPFLQGASRRLEEAYYMVAALFAYWHQGRDSLVANPPANLGASAAVLVAQESAHEESLDRRLTALLKSHHDDLPYHLRQAVGLLKSKDVGINWSQLLRDVLNWDHKDRFVQRNWAKAFWGRRSAPEAAPGAETFTD